MLVLLVCLMWTIALVGFLVKSAIGSEIIKNLRKRSVISKICALVSFIGFIAWGGLKPDSNMQSTTTSQIPSMNDTFITMSNGGIVSDGTNIISSTTSFSEEELATRLVFLDVGTNTTFVSYNDDAIVNDKWVTTGAAYDYMYIKPEYWSFPLAGETNKSVFVSTTGNISFDRPITRTGSFSNDYAVISPFRAVQGVLPEYKWDLLGTNTQSRFWYLNTTYGSLILTWENFLLGRLTNSLVSYQSELFYNGEIEFRYDFSKLTENLTNVVVGYQQGNNTNYFKNLSINTLGVRVKRLPPSLANNHDEDSDGISDADEIFVYGTEPTLSDSDFDGKDDATEILDGSNPIDPDENDDGIRDFLSIDSNGLVVESYEDSTCAFVFGSNMPEGAQATLVINSTIIPITQSTQVVFLALEEGVLYDYKVYLPRNCLADFSFENTLDFVFPNNTDTFSMRNIQLDEKVMDKNTSVLFTRNQTLSEEFAVVYSGKVSNTILALIHESDFDVMPHENPCIHNDQADILLKLKIVPEIFMNGATITTRNLTEMGNNTFVLSVASPNIDTEISGEVIYSFETSKSEVQLCARAHMCESSGLYCLGCGVFHKGECPIHTTNCMVPFIADVECVCEPVFYELQLSDRNSNGVEDRYESSEDVEIYNLKNIQLIDNEDHCCCNSFSERTYIDIKKSENITILNQYTDSIDIFATTASGNKGYSEIVYDVYEVGEEEPINTLTNKILVVGIDLLLDYDDNGVIDANDKGMQNGFTDQSFSFYSTDKLRIAQLRYEGPSDLGGILSCTNAVLYSSDKTNLITNLPYSFNSSSELIHFSPPIKNGMLSFDVRCGDYLLKTYDIKLVDTSLTNIFTSVEAEIQFPFYGSGTTNNIQIIGLSDTSFMTNFSSDGKWTVNVPNGIYKLRVFFNKVFYEGSTNLSKECLLVVGNVDFEKGSYGLKCGDKNPLNVHLFDGFNLPTNVVWRITPELNDGAYFGLDGDSRPVYESYATEGNINFYAGNATNQYTLSAWYEEVCIIEDNVSVDVFPYEIAIDNTILSSNIIARSKQVHTKPFHVETTSSSTNHCWRLEGVGSSNSDGAFRGKIGLNNQDISHDEIISTGVYYKAFDKGERYNLTAQHEIYENVTDTVEIRVCDIFFNPISCEGTAGNIINPRGFVQSEKPLYKIEIKPEQFIEERIKWDGAHVAPVNQEGICISVNLQASNIVREITDDEVTIKIPNYFEEPPKFSVRIYNGYKTIMVRPIIVKNSANEYITYGRKFSNLEEYVWSNRDEFGTNFVNQIKEGLTLANKVYRQAGIKFQADNVVEKIIPQHIFYTGENTITNFNQTTYNGINLYLVDSFVGQIAGYGALTSHTLEANNRRAFGVVIHKETLEEAFPHEIGHFLGLDDIYDFENLELALKMYNKDEIPSDFTGVLNYYNKNRSLIIVNLLMYGYLPTSGNSNNQTLPLGMVFGTSDSKDETKVGLIKVGLNKLSSNIISYGELSDEN